MAKKNSIKNLALLNEFKSYLGNKGYTIRQEVVFNKIMPTKRLYRADFILNDNIPISTTASAATFFRGLILRGLRVSEAKLHFFITYTNYVKVKKPLSKTSKYIHIILFYSYLRIYKN